MEDQKMPLIVSEAENIPIASVRIGDCFAINACTVRLIERVGDGEGWTLRFRILARTADEEYARFEMRCAPGVALPRVLRVEESWKA
jgi:hypothetical protein